jgi:hypothetical protein
MGLGDEFDGYEVTEDEDTGRDGYETVQEELGVADQKEEMASLMDEWRGYWDEDERQTFGEAYGFAEEAASRREVCDAALERYCRVTEFEPPDGIMLSAVMKDMDDEIRLPDMGGVKYLGIYNSEGRIHVEGDVGAFAGYCMEGGELVAEGDAHGYLGAGMEGGRIGVVGDAGEAAGFELQGGEIEIGGSTGKATAKDMEEGTLIVHGLAAGDAGEGIGHGMTGGEVYVSTGWPHLKIEGGEMYHREDGEWTMIYPEQEDDERGYDGA